MSASFSHFGWWGRKTHIVWRDDPASEYADHYVEVFVRNAADDADEGLRARISKAIVGGLKLCIIDHGPITPNWIGSAAKRIMGGLEPVFIDYGAPRPKKMRPSTDPQYRFQPMPDADGGADFSLVTLDGYGKPSCREHGAMNKVSASPPGFWRCIALAGDKKNPCRAGCMDIARRPEKDAAASAMSTEP